MGYKYLEKYEIIRVVPTLDTNAHADDDVIFTGLEIPNAVREDGGCSQLMHMFVVDRADQGDIDIDFFFTEKNTSFGSQNASADISAANLKAIGFCGWALLDGAAATTGNNVDNATIHKVSSAGGSAESLAPVTFLQAESGSKSVYCHAVSRSGTPTFAADSLDLVFHIEK
tara:strand:+ start:274 stop:786 length:513 start_codon:yes stop_codon:yes gene_type:complete